MIFQRRMEQMQISEIVAFLESAYQVLNLKYFGGELPPVVITVQSSPKAYGHYTTWDAWKKEDTGFREINISAETLDRPIENTIATLIHEMVHHYCAMTGIKDTSRGGTYHNKNFKREAELRGLVIGYDTRIGHSPTSPSESLVAFIEEQGWTGIDLSRKGLVGLAGGKGGGKTSNVRKYKCPTCGCSVRATKEVHIGCLDCNEPMELEEK